MSGTSMFNETTHREILLPSLGNINDCRTYLKKICGPQQSNRTCDLCEKTLHEAKVASKIRNHNSK